jgi:hypothetical protein
MAAQVETPEEQQQEAENILLGKSRSFTDGKPMYCTAETLATWKQPASRSSSFKCGPCGHRFKAGDYYRWLYTNNLPGYGGNPFTCEKCDGPDVIEKWKRRVDAGNERAPYTSERL